MNEKKTQANGNQEDLLIVELDERLEFGVAAIDGDLEEDDNSLACINVSGCFSNADAHNCVNQASCC